MRRFLITSPAFNGEADITFDADGRLIKIDVMATSMSVSQVQSFKAKVPAHVDSLAEAFADTRATIVETSVDITFDMFWNAYDKKINAKRCKPIWAKLTVADQVKAYHGVKAYDRYLNKESWRPKADPEKYLKDRYWENEYK